MAQERFEQIGITALRAPDGSFLPAVPLYVKTTAEVVEQHETALVADVAGIFASKYKQYVEGVRNLSNAATTR